jgi:hypothetical protein
MVQVLNMTFWVTGLSASLIGTLCLVKYGRALLEAKRDTPAGNAGSPLRGTSLLVHRRTYP